MTSAPRTLSRPRRSRLPGGMTGPQAVILLVVLVGMALAGNFATRRFLDDGATQTATVQSAVAARRTIESTVSATGTASAINQVRLTFPSSGTVQDVLVKAGDRVTAGQTLATMNTFTLEIRRDQARTTLASAQARLEALLAGPTGSDIASAQQTVAAAQSSLASAQNNLFNLLAGASADDIAQARASLERAQAGLNIAQANYDKLISGTDLNLRSEYTTLQTAKSAYQQALGTYTTRTAPPPPGDVANAQGAVQTAQAGLESAQARLRQVQAGPDALDVANARNQVTSAQAALTAARERLNQVQAGTSQTEIQALQAQVRSAESALTSAQARLQQVQTPNNAGDVAAARASLDSANAGLTTARIRLQEAQNSTSTAASDVAAAQASLNSAQANYQSIVAQYSTCASTGTGCSGSGSTSTTTPSLPNASAQLEARARIAQAEASVASAQAALARAQNAALPLQSTVASAQQAVIAAEAQVVSAQNNLNKLTAPAATADVASAQQAVSSAQAQLTTAQNNLAKAQAGPTAADVTAAQQSVASAETALKNAENNLNKLLAPPAAADIASAQQGVTSAEGQLTTARNNLNKLLNGAEPQDIAAARAALDTAKSNLDKAQQEWDRLVARTDIESRPEYTALAQARADYQTALTTFNNRTAPPAAGDVAVAQAAVDSANASVNSALARLATVLGGSLPTDIEQARQTVINAELALKQAQNDLDNASVRAPISGTVVTVGVNPGDPASSQTAAFTLLNPEQVRIDATVDESNAARLKQGMTVNVTFDALQGQRFQGIVAQVTPSGTTQQGVVTFPITVMFNAQGNTIAPGTTASLTIVTESRPNVVAVPSRAVRRQGGQSVVTVQKEDGSTETRTVVTGITGNSMTEIREGLNEGEVVLTSTTQGTQTAGAGGAFGTGGVPGFGGGGGGGGPVIR